MHLIGQRDGIDQQVVQVNEAIVDKSHVSVDHEGKSDELIIQYVSGQIIAQHLKAVSIVPHVAVARAEEQEDYVIRDHLDVNLAFRLLQQLRAALTVEVYQSFDEPLELFAFQQRQLHHQMQTGRRIYGQRQHVHENQRSGHHLVRVQNSPY